MLSPFQWLSPAGANGKLTIFIFHRVMPQHDSMLPDEPDACRFARIARFISRYFSVLSLGEATRRLESGTLPAAAAAITFDDGYKDNLTIAAPILKHYGLSATFFIATGYTGGGRMWNDTILEAMRMVSEGTLDWREFGLGQHLVDGEVARLRALQQVRAELKYRPDAERREIAKEIASRAGLGQESHLMMSREDLIELKRMGMEIGGHTVTHPILAKLDDVSAAAEIGDGRAQLAEWLGEAPDVFAYPNGLPGKDYTQRDVNLVRNAGYRAAVATTGGYAKCNSDLFQLPRSTPWDHDMPRFALRCAARLLHSPNQ